MNVAMYNGSLAVGVLSVTAGAWMLCGIGCALVVFGVLVLALTLYTTWVTG